MPSTEPPDYTGLIYVGCLCGRCTIDDNAGYDDFALSTCLYAAQDMFKAIEYGISADNEGPWIALRTLRELLINARMLLCMQRQAARARGLCAS